MRSDGRTKVDPGELLHSTAASKPNRDTFVTEASKTAADLALHATRRGVDAAWIGLDWLGDFEVAQLVPLGPDLYNGSCGFALFLAAHASVTRCDLSKELALAAISYLRRTLKAGNAARIARSLGLGAGTGLGSIIYAFALMAKLLDEIELSADAHAAATLFTDDLIAADRALDVLGGSAGGIFWASSP